MPNAQSNLFELYRSGLLSALDVMKVCLEGAEKLRNQQLAAIRNAMTDLARSCDEVGEAKGFETLFALQSRISAWQFEKVLGHWSGIAQAGSESQAEVLRQVHKQLVQIREQFRDTLNAATGGSEPLMNAIQSMLTTTSTAYALSARATEEAAKFGAAQAATADAAIRYQAEKAGRVQRDVARETREQRSAA
jgi:phasin family protein